MERDDAVTRLPVMYQRVLAMLDQGLSRERIAAELGTEANAVQPLIALAVAKLARLKEDACEP